MTDCISAFVDSVGSAIVVGSGIVLAQQSDIVSGGNTLQYFGGLVITSLAGAVVFLFRNQQVMYNKIETKLEKYEQDLRDCHDARSKLEERLNKLECTTQQG